MPSRIRFDSCPLCQDRAIKMLRNGDCSKHALYNQIISPVINWLRCDNCEHVFTDGYFPPEILAKVFERTHDNQRPGWNFEQMRRISARMVEHVARYINVGPWLDVGFGNGSLLFTAEEWGFDAVGLDLRPTSVEAIGKLGLEAHCIDVTAFDSPNRFSVVSMADVLEHMPFPKDGLAAAHRLLVPDGILFVSMPNFGCAAWRLLDIAKANPYWGELEHYHNFSRARLYALLNECGFEPLHYTISERYRVCMEVIARRR